MFSEILVRGGYSYLGFEDKQELTSRIRCRPWWKFAMRSPLLPPMAMTTATRAGEFKVESEPIADEFG